GSLLLDVCSVKMHPCGWLKKYTPEYVDIMGTHPMFGPTTSKFNLNKKEFNIKGKQIVLCPLRIKKDRQERVEKFLKKIGLEVIITTPKEHDFQNAKTLSLVHFLGRSLTRAGIGEQKIYTPGYKDVLKILPHTNNDNWQLFYDMNNFNPYASQVRKKFIRSCLDIEEEITKSGLYNNFNFNRKMISEIDEQVFSLIEKRMKYVRELSTTKKERGLKVVDQKREKDLIGGKIKKFNLSDSFIREIYKLIFKESYKNQK
ncbi:prephenate dehydrogenase/arogenate dehydrogenase family protein, partial [bacterium]|nr:prephenate dehydrogenase/arogenate dehydrogenase family protein [bacterium]